MPLVGLMDSSCQVLRSMTQKLTSGAMYIICQFQGFILVQLLCDMESTVFINYLSGKHCFGSRSVV